MMMRTRSYQRETVAAVAALLVVVAHAAVRAQSEEDLSNLTLEDLMRVRVEQVYGAARRVQPTTEAPSAVTIVTAEDIARHGYRTLADILRGVRGLYVTDDRNYSYVGARGFARAGDYNTRILLVVDGHRLNDAVYDQAPIGRELGLDPSTFQRVEIIRGPASALYGTSAFFAVVNVTTRRGADINGAWFTAEAGGLGARKVTGSAGRALSNGLDVAVSASVEHLDGHGTLYYPAFDAPDTNDGVAVGLDGETMRSVRGRVSYQNLTLSGAYGWREKIVPTAAYGTAFNAPGLETIDQRAFIDAAYERTAGQTTYAVRGYADVYEYDGAYPYDAESEDQPISIFTDYGYGRWWGADARASRPLPHGQTLTGGFEFRHHTDQDQGAHDPGILEWAANSTTRVYAAYIQDEVRVRERLLLTAGGRYDAYSGFDRFSPRASVVFTATPTRSFKYLYGTAFRAPNAYELDYLTNGVRNDALRAETIATHEAVWEEYAGDWLRTSVSAYYSDADRLIALMSDEDGLLSQANTGRVSARGLELEAEARRGGLRALASYGWQRAEDQDTQDALTNSPRHLGKVRFSAPGPVDSTLAIELLTMSERLTVSGGRTPGFTVANLHYVQPLGGGVALTASVRNLFDADYADPASEEHLQDVIPQDDRRALVGLRWSWTPRP